MRRRELLTVMVGVAAAATAHAERALPIVGYLRRTEPIPVQFAAFRDVLRTRGFEDGRTIRIEQRHAAGDAQRLRAYAAELVQINAKVIAVDGLATARAVLDATRIIPIVFALVTDPTSLGITQLNRPGGNATGVLNLIGELHGKRLDLLREIVPRLRRVAVLLNPRNVENAALNLLRPAAAALGIELALFEADGFEAWPATFDKMVQAQVDAGLLAGDATFASRPPVIAALAAARRLPMMYPERHFVTAGGLISYGPDLLAHWQLAADYVAKVLDGASPSELPIEQPTRFEFVVNVRAARGLGLSIPESILLRATEVIE